MRSYESKDEHENRVAHPFSIDMTYVELRWNMVTSILRVAYVKEERHAYKTERTDPVLVVIRCDVVCGGTGSDDYYFLPCVVLRTTMFGGMEDLAFEFVLKPIIDPVSECKGKGMD